MDELRQQLKRNPFKNSEGKIVLAQFPNWQLWGAIVATLAQRVTTDGSALNMAKALQLVFILFWAYEEVVRGDNLFRRCLGMFVIVITVLGVYRPY